MTGVLSPDKIADLAARLHEQFQMNPSQQYLPVTVLPAAVSLGAIDADYEEICNTAAQKYDLRVCYRAPELLFIREKSS